MKNGNDYLLFIKVDTEWKTVACLRSNGIDISSSDVVSETKCNDGWEESEGGTGSWAMPFEGDAIDESADPSQVSYDFLFDMAVEKKKYPVKIAEVEGTYVRYGVARLNSYSENQSVNSPFGFTGSLKGIGKPLKTEPVGG
jgi:predicted secreted protein